jgi:hypothetical protein
VQPAPQEAVEALALQDPLVPLVTQAQLESQALLEELARLEQRVMLARLV